MYTKSHLFNNHTTLNIHINFKIIVLFEKPVG